MTDTPAGLADLDSLSAQIKSDMDQAGDLESQIQALSTQIQGLSTPSQSDMTQLQSLMKQYDDVVASASSAAKQRSDAMAGIMNNLP
jgi:hypothetical protein